MEQHIFDFNVEDGLVNPEPIDGTDKVERIILTLPTYMDESLVCLIRYVYHIKLTKITIKYLINYILYFC